MTAEDTLIQLARDRFDQGESAVTNQRTRELEALRFYAGDQWDPAQKMARMGMAANVGGAGLPPIPARPTYVINKVRQPVRQVLNDAEEADFDIEIVPADDFGDLAEPNPQNEMEIELREGLIRRMDREPETQDAREWAFSRAVEAGNGWYRVITRYVRGSKKRDQDITTERIFNQNTVVADPSGTDPTGRDIWWLFEGIDMTFEQYRMEFGKNPAANRVITAGSSSSDADWRSLGDDAPGWATYYSSTNDKGERIQSKTRMIRVMNYWYAEAGEETEDDPEPKRKVTWCKFDGYNVLEKTEWPTEDIPYIKIVGEELHPYDNEKREQGIVEPAMDANRGFNAMASKLTEVVGFAPIPPFLMPESAMGTGQYNQWWQLASTRSFPFLPFVDKDATGQPNPPPSKPGADNTIQPVAIALQMFDEAVKSTTGIPDSQLGTQDPHVKSGKMALALINQGQHGTSHYLNNLKRSIRREAEIKNNLLYPIYGTRPGRLARIVDGEGEPQHVRIGASVVGGSGMGSQKGSGLPDVAGAGPQQVAHQPTLNVYQLTDSSWNIVCNVVKNSGTRREQESSIVASLLEANPSFITWFGDLFFKNQDGPGHQQMAERAAVMLDPKIQQMIDQKKQGQQPLPPAVQQKMAQQGQQLDDAHKLLQKAYTEIQTEQVKNQSTERIKAAEAQRDVQMEQIKQAAAIELQRMKDATSIEVAKINALTKGVMAQGQAEDEQIALHTQLAHDATMQAVDQQHQQAMAQQGFAHQAALGAVNQDAASQQQASQQAHEADQASQAQTAASQEAQANRDAAAQQPQGESE